MSSLPKIAIIELGSQYTFLIERTLRELGFRSVILDPKRATDWLKKNLVNAVILSGSEASVCNENAPRPPEEIFSLHHEPVPVLGICYGMQWLAARFGGKVEEELKNRDYGEVIINLNSDGNEDRLFRCTPLRQSVWMSHGDSVVLVPKSFKVLARTESGTIAAMANDGVIWGAQFHPEVTHTTYGKIILGNFLDTAGCEKDWKPESLVRSIQEKTLAELGNRKAIIGFSGGVDSTTLAKILALVLKDRLLAITIDAGQFRENELKEIKKHAASAGVRHKIVDARKEFLEGNLWFKLQIFLSRYFVFFARRLVDAEYKRRRFKKFYTKILMRESEIFGATAILQGTLAPDRIESGATGGAKIKSHHNVGLKMGKKLLQIHPIDNLFKYEVRALAKEVGLPESVWNRQPFPGPGLLLRVVGKLVTDGTLGIVRWADLQVREILLRHDIYNKISQLVVAYVGVPTVGVKGDTRSYGGAIVIRPVETVDFMTTSGFHLPKEVEDEILSVLTRHPYIARGWFDYTNKPPATTEME